MGIQNPSRRRRVHDIFATDHIAGAPRATFPSAACAELFDPEDGMLDMSRYLQDNSYGFLPVPMAITEPAVGYGGAVWSLLHGKGTRDGDNFIPPPITAFGGGGTQNGTWFVGGGHRHTRNNDRIRYLVLLGYANIKLDIYSDGLSSFNKIPLSTRRPAAMAVCKTAVSRRRHADICRRLSGVCENRGFRR